MAGNGSDFPSGGVFSPPGSEQMRGGFVGTHATICRTAISAIMHTRTEGGLTPKRDSD
jgi:hypothetical protein